MDIKEEIGNIIFDYCKRENPYNDEITRNELINLIKGHLFNYSTIIEYEIKCDRDNNPTDLIDNNGFRLDLYIKEKYDIKWRHISYTIEYAILDINEINE